MSERHDNDVLDDLDAFVEEQSASSASFAGSYVDALRRSELVRSLVAQRKHAGLRQADVADRMGTVQSSVSELESGAVDPHLSTVQRYARAIGVQLHFRLRSTDGVVEFLNAAPGSARDWAPRWRERAAGARVLRQVA